MDITQEATTGNAENLDNGLQIGSSPVVGTTLKITSSLARKGVSPKIGNNSEGG